MITLVSALLATLPLSIDYLSNRGGGFDFKVRLEQRTVRLTRSAMNDLLPGTDCVRDRVLRRAEFLIQNQPRRCPPGQLQGWVEVASPAGMRMRAPWCSGVTPTPDSLLVELGNCLDADRKN